MAGNKEELRRKIHQREMERERAASHFKLKLEVPPLTPGTKVPPEAQKPKSTPQKHPTPTPTTPSVRRKREEEAGEEDLGTPSKRERPENTRKKVTRSLTEEIVEKIKEDPGEAVKLPSPSRGKRGAQGQNHTCRFQQIVKSIPAKPSILKSKTEIVEEPPGRLGGGQNRPGEDKSQGEKQREASDQGPNSKEIGGGPISATL